MYEYIFKKYIFKEFKPFALYSFKIKIKTIIFLIKSKK